MGNLVIFAGICALPSAAFWAMAKGLEWMCSYDHVRTRPARPVRTPSLQHLVGDLRRLEREYRSLERSTQPLKVQRLKAVSLAYDDVLCESCVALGLEPPPSRPLSSLDRLEAEAELARHGLTW